jgi:hypothetical protein
MNAQHWLADWPLPTLGALLGLWSVLTTWLVIRYRRPNLKYRKTSPTESTSPTVQYLVRSFEPDNLTGTLRLRLAANAPLDVVEVVAGPWLDGIAYGNGDRKVVIVTLNGFPAEGVIGLRASPNSGSCELVPIPPPKDDAGPSIMPRRWEEIQTPYHWLRAYLPRVVVGIAFAAVAYLLGCALLYRCVPDLFANPPGTLDLLLLGSLVPATVAVFLLAVPRRGKDTFTGAIDWDLAVRAETVSRPTDAPASSPVAAPAQPPVARRGAEPA